MKFLKKYIPEIVYGGIDGAITTFAVTAGVVGAGLSPSIILILGFANLFADGFSMAASNYLSVQARQGGTKRPIRSALTTFGSFVLVGSIPILPYLGFRFGADNAFLLSSIFTAIAFLVVGALKGFVINKNPLSSGFKTLIIGGIAASIAYIIGFFLQSLA